MVADDNKYIAKFDREDLREDLPTGDEVEMKVTGKLFDGRAFEGSDIIRVIDKGKGK
jgi:FKBP-type peptidyl-prolyl cis-trans isomerase